MNGNKVEEDISSWLYAGGEQHVDMFVLGLEEMVDLTASNVVSESQSQKRAQIWLDMVQMALRKAKRTDVGTVASAKSQNDEYYCVGFRILVGIFLCVYARVSLRPTIQEVMSVKRWNI